MKYLGTHHDTGKTLPTVGNAIWLSYYLGQYKGNFADFMIKSPCDVDRIRKDVYIDERTYRQQLDEAKGVDLIILCVRCLQDEFKHFNNYYMSFSQQLCEYVYKLGYKNVKVELFSEPIEIVTPAVYTGMLADLRKALNHFRRDYNLQILAGAGDLHIETHRKYYKYLRDMGFHDFDAWSIHCINDPFDEMHWAVNNLGDKPIHITEYTELEYILAYGANASGTLSALNKFLKAAHATPKIKSLFQVFPARISGKYELWSVHSSKYLDRLKEFYNKYIKEVKMREPEIVIKKGEIGIAVEYLQEMLVQTGYNPGKVDGWFGNKTLEALNNYQKDKGLPVLPYCDLHCMSYMIEHDLFKTIMFVSLLNSKTK